MNAIIIQEKVKSNSPVHAFICNQAFSHGTVDVIYSLD